MENYFELPRAICPTILPPSPVVLCAPFFYYLAPSAFSPLACMLRLEGLKKLITNNILMAFMVS